MHKFRCYHCGAEIPEDTPLQIRGVATVEGVASLGDFHDNGVEWGAIDSWNEEAKCPVCGRYFTPDFLEYRSSRAVDI